jgi:hypothetical protein
MQALSNVRKKCTHSVVPNVVQVVLKKSVETLTCDFVSTSVRISVEYEIDTVRPSVSVRGISQILATWIVLTSSPKVPSYDKTLVLKASSRHALHSVIGGVMTAAATPVLD